MNLTGNKKLDRQFWEYHTEFPNVFTLYIRFGRELRAAGHMKGSSEQMIQRIRWECDINPNRKQGFKISNNHRKRYAILAKLTYPEEFGDFFRFREEAV